MLLREERLTPSKEAETSGLVRQPKPGDRLFRVSRERGWLLPLGIARVPKSGPPSPFLLIVGFAALIAIGTVVLILPISSSSGALTNLWDALFTATSAVTTTGLVVVDTGTYWSPFGQAVILLLIQIGGLSFITAATIFLLLARQKITLRQRMLVQTSIGWIGTGGVVKLAKGIALFTVAAEALGALVLFFRFSQERPLLKAGGEAVFHSVSAFNNAGFSTFPNDQSLTKYASDPVALGTIAFLIILGGISFMVIADFLRTRSLTKLSTDSKLVLVTTACLLALGTGVILLTEFSNAGTLASMPLQQKVLDSFFHSTVSRTAGFTAIDIGKMADYSLLFTAFLMFIGGATGSTAGGVKVNTFGMLVAVVWSALKGKEYAGAFGREFSEQQVHRAMAVVFLAMSLVFMVVLTLTYTERFRFMQLLFETASAFGTVGLSTGITPQLSLVGRLLISLVMFIGHLGPLTFALTSLRRQQSDLYRYPKDYVRIG